VFDLPPSRPDSGSIPEPVSLGTIAPSWSVLVSRDRLRPIGVRLTLAQTQPPAGEGAPPPLSALLDSVLAGFVADGASAFPHGLILIAPVDFGIDASLAVWSAPRNVLLEVAQAEVEDDDKLRLLFEIQRQGVRLALRIERGPPPPAERLKLFQYVVVADAELAQQGSIAWLALGVRDGAAAQRAFDLGAQAVVGWPTPLAGRTHPQGLQPMQRGVLELIRLVQADADIGDVERALKSEPVLAYMLLTLANSPAFMPGRSIASLHQAIALLGYARLTKWLVLLLVITSKTSNVAPLVYTAVARGFTVEYLEAAAGESRQRQDEGFIIGAFSMLDAIIGQPLAELVSEFVLPSQIGAALLQGEGPHAAYLARALAFERADAAAQALEADPRRPREPAPRVINAALLQALASTDALLAMV
jgi:EAL and modified HD-GYP domain-containing signal transduction protein